MKLLVSVDVSLHLEGRIDRLCSLISVDSSLHVEGRIYCLCSVQGSQVNAYIMGWTDINVSLSSHNLTSE